MNGQSGTVDANFWVRGIPVYGDLILAPMSGYSDMPFRLICREHGSAMSYTEFVNADAILLGIDKTWKRLEFDPSERPMTMQMFGSDEDKLVACARRLEDAGASIVDLNMGCSVNNVAGRGAGAGLLPDPVKIGRIFAKLSAALRIPVTGKIRLGWDERHRNYREVVRAIEEHGGALIAVHGRTKVQAYHGQADWDAIGEIKQVATVPILANGDVKSVADIDRIKAQTGCDGVMIGRAAIGNPWIFQRQEWEAVAAPSRFALARRHLDLTLSFYGGERGIHVFRKHVGKYMRGVAGISAFREELASTADVDTFVSLVDACEEYACELAPAV